MCKKLINSIKQLNKNLNRFKQWNGDTRFGYDSEDKFEDRHYISSFYKGIYFRLIFHNGLLIPCSNQFIFLTNDLERKLKEHNTIIRQKINSDNFSEIKLKVSDIVRSTIRTSSDYISLNEFDKDLFFFICLTAEFYKQIKTNTELGKLIQSDSKSKNYLVSLIKNNL